MRDMSEMPALRQFVEGVVLNLPAPVAKVADGGSVTAVQLSRTRTTRTGSVQVLLKRSERTCCHWAKVLPALKTRAGTRLFDGSCEIAVAGFLGRVPGSKSHFAGSAGFPAAEFLLLRAPVDAGKDAGAPRVGKRNCCSAGLFRCAPGLLSLRSTIPRASKRPLSRHIL
jgi:hypothetical protein